MKRQFLRIVLLLFAISFIGFYACKKERQESKYVKEDPNAALTKEAVEHYFYNNLIKKPGSIIKSNKISVSSSDKENWKHIMFDHSYESENAEASFVEIPVLYNQRPSMIVRAENDSLSESEIKETLNSSFDRLIIYKNKSTKAVDQRIVTYIPDKEYYLKHKKDISHNQFNKLDKDFNGFLIFRKWDDTPEYGVRINDGLQAGAWGYEQAVKNEKKSKTKAGCTTIITEYYQQTCFTLSAEDFSLTSCSSWLMTGYSSVSNCLSTGVESNPCYYNPNLCIYSTKPTPPPPAGGRPVGFRPLCKSALVVNPSSVPGSSEINLTGVQFGITDMASFPLFQTQTNVINFNLQITIPNSIAEPGNPSGRRYFTAAQQKEFAYKAYHYASEMTNLGHGQDFFGVGAQSKYQKIFAENAYYYLNYLALHGQYPAYEAANSGLSPSLGARTSNLIDPSKATPANYNTVGTSGDGC